MFSRVKLAVALFLVALAGTTSYPRYAGAEESAPCGLSMDYLDNEYPHLYWQHGGVCVGPPYELMGTVEPVKCMPE